jgi:hypothetical protein
MNTYKSNIPKNKNRKPGKNPKGLKNNKTAKFVTMISKTIPFYAAKTMVLRTKGLSELP